MQSRKDHREVGINLPEVWIQEVEKLILQNYQAQCDKRHKTFEVYGLTYPTEALVMVSFLDAKDPLIIPVTMIISADLEENQNQEKLLNSLIDSIGLFFDNYFSNPEEQAIDYISDWESAELNKVKFWYKITRENIGLTIIANELLKKNS